MTVETEALNGVDVEQLTDTINQVNDNQDLAKFNFRAHTEWMNGALSRTEIQDFYGAGKEDNSRSEPFVMEGDELSVLLGSNKAPNAVETVLHALTSCLAVGFVYNAAAKGIEIEDLSFDISGDLDLHAFLGLSDESRPGYDNIKVSYKVNCDASREEVEELCEYVQKTSPVMDIIKNPVPVTVEMVN